MGIRKTNARASVSILETVVLAAMLIAVYLPALSFSATALIPVLYAAFLLLTYHLVRHVAGRLHPAFGPALFFLALLTLSLEIAIHHFTGLHINRFVLSLLAQPHAVEQIGIPRYFIAVLAAPSLVTMGASLRWRHHVKIALRSLAMIAATTLGAAQLIHALLLYERDPNLVENEHRLPFFIGLHHYYADHLFAPLLGPRADNPMARPLDSPATDTTPEKVWEITTPRNFLLVVIDSMRAEDIAADPDLAPNLRRLGAQGHLSLTQDSVSNCTHFSIHTMLTGELATTFGTSRRGRIPKGIFVQLKANGYHTSTSEAFSLDWYDIAHTYLAGAERTVVPDEKDGGKDVKAVAETLRNLSSAGTGPWAHLLYLNGPHFPYDAAPGAAFGRESYLSAIQRSDALVGGLMDRLAESGVLENTLVIVTADHGEQLSEGDIIGHGSSLNDHQLIVPLLILNAQNRTTGITGHRDIMPFVKAEMGAGPLRAIPRTHEIRLGCDYDYPNAFTLIGPEGRVDFRYENGLLFPATGDRTAPRASQEQIKDASIRLIEMIRSR